MSIAATVESDFSLRKFKIAGINIAILSFVSGFSAPFVGILYERTGSYELPLLGMIAGYVISALLYLAIGRYRYTTDFKVMPAPAVKPQLANAD